MDRFRALKTLLKNLRGEIRQRPIPRWATVTQVSPLLVRLDGEADPIAPQASCVRTVTVGQRLYCMEVERRVTVLVAVEP